MKNKKEYRFAIFGRIVYTDHFIKELHQKGFPKPLVIVSEDDEYLRDKRLLSPYGLYGNLESLQDKGICDIYKLKSVSTDNAINLMNEYNCNIAISINCRNIIKKNVIDFFKGNIFNIHDSYLPNERGGALNTWRILNGINSVGNTIHYLEEGIDTGSIVIRRQLNIEKPFPKPIDFLKLEAENCKIILTEFLDLIINNNQISSTPQENDKSLYFPRLFTEKNGLINWDWAVEDVEKFIRAFSDPYPGAFTFFRDQKIQILDSFIDKSNLMEIHPFANGKVVTILDNGHARVIAGGKFLIITKVLCNGKNYLPSELLSIKHTFNQGDMDLNMSKLHLPTTKEMNKAEK